jgi:hypothetical protein
MYRPEEVSYFDHSYIPSGTLTGSGTYSGSVNLFDDMDRAVKEIEMSVLRLSDSQVIDKIRFPVNKPWHPDSPVLFYDVRVQPVVNGYLKTHHSDMDWRTHCTIPHKQKVTTAFYAWNDSGIDYEVRLKPSIDGEVEPGFGYNGGFDVYSTGTWVGGSKYFYIIQQPSGPITEVMMLLEPISGTGPTFHIYQPVHLTFMDTPAPTLLEISKVTGALEIRWDCETGYNTRVLRSFDMENWTPVSLWFRSYWNANGFQDSTGLSYDKVFYRIEILAPGETPVP